LKTEIADRFMSHDSWWWPMAMRPMTHQRHRHGTITTPDCTSQIGNPENRVQFEFGEACPGVASPWHGAYSITFLIVKLKI
jgi:hypothetical protein